MGRLSRDRLEAILHDVGHYLPAQAPLEVFVHHNTLHAYEKLPFHEGLAAAFDKTGARGYLEETQYRAAHRRGRITDADVAASLTRWVPQGLPTLPEGVPSAVELCRLALLHDVGTETRAGLSWELTEHRADAHFAEDAPRVAKNRIVRESTAWLEEVLAAQGPEAVARLLVGDEGDTRHVADELEVRFGRKMTAAGLTATLKRDAEAAAVAALWQTARRTAARLEVPRVRRVQPTFPRDAVLAVGADDPNDFVHPPLILLASAFLDRGQALWAMPDREHGFFVAFRRVLGAGHAVRPSWLAGLGTRLRAWEARAIDAEDAALELLDELGIAERDVASFIERKLLFLPGWAGMFHRLESAPRTDEHAPRPRLVDFLAVRLCLDHLALAEVGKRLGFRGPVSELVAHCATLPHLAPREEANVGTDERSAWPLFRLAQVAGLAAPRLERLGDANLREILELLERFDRRAHLRVWHEAYELRYRDELLGALAAPRPASAAPATRDAQVVFCIDDRNESIRRHLEELSPAYATYGTAGFFNLAIAYQGIDDPSTFPLCPVVVTPQHRISEEPVDALRAAARRRRMRWASQASAGVGWASRSLVLGPIVISVVGMLTALPLLATIFAPWVAGRLRRAAEERLFPSVQTRLSLPRVGVDAEGRLQTGFTIEEKATRVATLLENIGLVEGFAPIVAIIGHHSSSVNNPHFAAYACGACGGRSGGPNARLFARMANRPEVRAVLRERGIDIPDATVFVGGVHDTATDRITFYDQDENGRAMLAGLERVLAAAAARNAHERCRKFSSEPKNLDPEGAQRRVEARAWDLSQARPELGHATNAACIVGRRELTQGLFLDRRTFLVSYDPTIDGDGAILERTLLAAAPVCAGINLEYFFSTTDRERFGAGTKLPHNVTGLVGVMNGAASDLRTGLPSQMIEIHEPIRLQLVVEAAPEILSAILARQPELAALVKNEWVVLVAVHPETRAMSAWDGERAELVPFTPTSANLASVERSVDWYDGKADPLPPARVASETEVRDVA